MNSSFDPDAAAAAGSGLFGLDCDAASATVHVIPVPFEATTSYRRGTASGPAAIFEASKQVELFDLELGPIHEAGIHMLEADPSLCAWNEEASRTALEIMNADDAAAAELEPRRERVNELCAEMNRVVHASVARALAEERLPVLVGGDHSVSFGAIEACAARHAGLGILQFDAHADMRDAYQGFTWSHASVLFNVVQRIGDIGKIVQVGLRDLGEREFRAICASEERVQAVFDADWGRARDEGEDLRAIARNAIATLPESVYLTFDVDGLDPTLCPNTGTPVPGGLIWSEVSLWLTELAGSGRRVVGLDLTEVSPGEQPGRPAHESWDAIVGARLLYRLIGTALATR